MTPDEVDADTARRIDAIRKRVLAQARRLLGRTPHTDAGLSVSTKEELSTLADIRAACVSLLRNAGREEVLPLGERAIARVLDAAASDVTDSGVGGGVDVSFTARQKAAVLNRARGALDVAAEAFTTAIDEVRMAVDAGAHADRELDPFINAVAERMDVAFSRASTAVSTAIMGSYRAAVVQLAASAAKATREAALFLYDGPSRDKKLRPFCRKRVGRVYSLRRIKQMDNGQGLEVETYCGGWRCRHTWSSITREDAEAEGYPIIT